MSGTLRDARVAAAICACVPAVAGCGGTHHSGVTVLRMGSGVPGLVVRDPAAGYFVRRVAELSGGHLRVAVQLEPDPNTPPTARDFPVSERRLVREVRDGRDDLAWVPTHALDGLGVVSMRALDAPMLVDGYALQARIVAGPLGRAMLAGVRRAGVVGVALLAGRLRRPLGVRRPLVRLSDWRGLATAGPASSVRSAGLRALGARVRSPQRAYYVRWSDMTIGTLGALETDLESAAFDGSPQLPGYVTQNVRLWPETAAIVANPARLARLSAREERWLRRAGADAQARSPALADRDRPLARALCASGTRFATASRSELMALARAWRPVYADLGRDALTRSLIARIARLKGRTAYASGLHLGDRCGISHRPRPALPRSGLPDGVYRTQITTADLRAGHASPVSLEQDRGTLTLTLRGGRYALRQREPDGPPSFGRYGGELPRLMLRQGTTTTQLVATLRGDELRLVGVDVADNGLAVWFGAHPWRRIG
jgi:TRAP-type C4-dicarboxylate transport system substrate-binding protein